MQGHLDLGALVLGQGHTLFQVQPVVSADRNTQEAQATDSKDAAQQGQGLPSTGAHLPGHLLGGSSCDPTRAEWALRQEGGKVSR